MEHKIKLSGGSHFVDVSHPIIGVTGTGKNTFIWIGNDAEDNKKCYATLSGRKRLEKLAKKILESIK